MTIRDIAELAGCGVGTVSRVLNGSSNVALETRERVNRIIEQYDFHPNHNIRSVARKKTFLILVMMPSLTTPFYSEVIKGAQAYFHAEGYEILLCDTGKSAPRERDALDLLKQRAVDGIIVLSTKLSADELQTINSKYPLVFCCEEVEGSGCTSVSINNHVAAYDAVSALVSIGCRQIAYMGGIESASSDMHRESGYRDALADANLAADERLILRTDYSFEGGLAACNGLFEKGIPFDSLFVISESMAAGAVQSIREHGLTAGEDIKLIACDDTDVAKICVPSLTTVSQPRYELGYTAAQLLMERILDIHVSQKNVFLNHKIAIRESAKDDQNGDVDFM